MNQSREDIINDYKKENPPKKQTIQELNKYKVAMDVIQEFQSNNIEKRKYATVFDLQTYITKMLP